jgi:autotransporter-associated beta strand protein
MAVGGNGNGSLRVRNGGSLTVGNGTGKIQLANHPLSEGNLLIGSGGTAGLVTASEIFNGEGRATVTFNHSDPSLSFASKFTGLKTVNGYLNIRHDGPGTTILTAPESNLAGSVTVSAGTLIVNGKIMGSVKDVVVDDMVVQEKTIGVMSVGAGGTLGGTGFIEGNTTISGTLSPGMSAGILEFGGNLKLESSSNVRIELGGLIRGLGFDGIDIAGSLIYGGTLEIVLLGGFAPEEGSVFDLFDGFDSSVGTFESILFSAEGYTGVFDPATGMLTVIPEPGSVGLIVFAAAGFGLRRMRAPRAVISGRWS